MLSSRSPPTASKSAPSTSQIEEQHSCPDSPESIKASLPPASSLPLSSAGLSRSPDDISTLRLHMETQELEIKRLRLELQLAQGKLSATATSTSNDGEAQKAEKSEKFLGDQRAPQRIINPQDRPHIFAAGEPKLFNELTIVEFSAGYIVIVQRCKDQSRREAMLNHFHDLMVLVSSYTWSSVRTFHYKVVQSIVIGLASWGILSTPLNSPFSYPPLSSRTLQQTPQADLKTSPRPARPPSLRYHATKSASPGHGMKTARTKNASYGTSASSASEIIRPKAVQNGSILFPHAAQNPLATIDYMSACPQLLCFKP